MTAAELAGWAIAWSLTGLMALVWLFVAIIVIGAVATACALLLGWRP